VWNPAVSVVVPTRGRPELVRRAVGSALCQTLRDIEVIVVVDGPDPHTRDALAGIDDSRLRLVELAERGGAPAARNAGVRHARGRWTALLDDDDEWLPAKLETQLALAGEAAGPPPPEPSEPAPSGRTPIVACRLFMRTPRADVVLPRRLPAPGEQLSEYLTVRRGLFHGEGFIQTSTILAPTDLFRRVPFTDGLRRMQELDWSLRCLAHDDVTLAYADEPLVVWHADENRPRISGEAPWRESLEWLRDSRTRVTPRAYAALAMSVVASMAATSRSPRVFAGLLREARTHGRPGLTDYVTFLQVWLVPTGLRRAVRDAVLGRRRAAGRASSREAAVTR
jgi:glycosyltransferase involved in cell wall biosynthesis